MLHDKWLTARLAYLRGLEAPSEQQRQLLLLVDKLRRTDADSRILAALIKAEAAAERAQRARTEAARLAARDEEATRILEAINREAASREHDQELHNAAELLILAGLVDSGTHAPAFDPGELLGALLGLAEVPAEDPRRHEWKRAGEALLAEKRK